MAMMKWTPRQLGVRRWEPLREMEEISEQMDRLFDEFSERMGLPVWRHAPLTGLRVWTPSIDMVDKKDEVLVRTDLPGMEKKDIHVSISGDILTIRGERKTQEEVKEENFLSMETHYGSFQRTISLPVSVESDKIKAEYKNGVLELHIPKTKEVVEKAKEIAIE